MTKTVVLYDSFYATVEKFEVKDNYAEVWIYINAFPSEVKGCVVEKWLKNHVKEPGISVKEVETVEIASLLNRPPPRSYINLELSKKQLKKRIDDYVNGKEDYY